MASSRDPRLNKRPASGSPEDSSTTHKRLNAPSRLPGSVSAPEVVTEQLTAPVANMSAASDATHLDPFAAFFELAGSMGSLNIKLEHAQAELDRARREYGNLEEKFKQFPAIAEQKKSALVRAQEKVARITSLVEQQHQKESQVISAIRGGFVSREDFKSEAGELRSLHHKLTLLETKLSALESQATSTAASVVGGDAETIKGLSQRLDDLEKGETDMIQVVDAHITAKLEGSEQRVSGEIQTVKDQISEVNKVQHQNSVSINDCVNRLGKVEAAGPSQDALAAVSKSVSDLEERMQKYETENLKAADKPHAGEEPGEFSFQPIIPELEKPEDELKGMDLVLNEIEMLKSVTMGHTRQINNLTTDDVVKGVVDQMSVMYPDAKNFQKAAAAFNQHVTASNQSFKSLTQRVQTLETGAGQSVNQPLLNQRLDGLDKAVADGRAAYDQLSNKVDRTAKDVEQNQLDLLQQNKLLHELLPSNDSETP